MYKKIIVTILLLALCLMLGGCPFFSSAAHTRAHKKTINDGWTEIHQFTDRHFWNYDWDSPNDN